MDGRRESARTLYALNMARKRPTLSTLRAEVWAELRQGHDIIEAELVADGNGRGHLKWYGLCLNDKHVHVNTTVMTVEVAIHELMHRLHPRMSEQNVNNRTIRIMRRMSNADVRRWARTYKAVVKRRRTPLDVDAV